MQWWRISTDHIHLSKNSHCLWGKGTLAGIILALAGQGREQLPQKQVAGGASHQLLFLTSPSLSLALTSQIGSCNHVHQVSSIFTLFVLRQCHVGRRFSILKNNKVCCHQFLYSEDDTDKEAPLATMPIFTDWLTQLDASRHRVSGLNSSQISQCYCCFLLLKQQQVPKLLEILSPRLADVLAAINMLKLQTVIMCTFTINVTRWGQK